MGILETVQRTRQAAVRVRMMAEQMLYAGTGSREPDAKRDGILRDEPHALDERGMTFREVPAGGQSARACEEELDPLLGRDPRREESERACEPMGSARGGAMRGRLPGLAQRGNRRCVALSARSLDVVRAFDGAGAASRERIGAPLVRAKSPRCRRRLVDRAPDKGVAETKAAGYVGLTNEVEAPGVVLGG